MASNYKYFYIGFGRQETEREREKNKNKTKQKNYCKLIFSFGERDGDDTNMRESVALCVIQIYFNLGFYFLYIFFII